MTSLASPEPAITAAVRTREEDEAIILASVEMYLRVFKSKPDDTVAKQNLQNATGKEVRVIADAILSDPYNFRGTLIKDITEVGGLPFTANICAVYSKDIHPGRSLHFRARSITTALQSFTAAHDALFSESKPLSLMDEEWNLCHKDEIIQSRARRFVAMACADSSNLAKMSPEVKSALTLLMLDDSRSKHHQVAIDLIRTRGAEEITMSQLAFVFDGGSTAIFEGAL